MAAQGFPLLQGRATGGLPGDAGRKELREEIVVVGLELLQVGFGVPLGVEIVYVEFVDPLQTPLSV